MFARNTLAVAIAAAAGLGASAPLSAQAPESQGRALEEIVVTAARREQSIQDVAVSVTAISGDALQRAYAQDATDLNGIAPNVQLMPVGAFQNATAFYIRGVGSTDIESAAEPGIAVLVNDVYQGRVSTALTDFLDIESVEILRGPQGTLFGRNAAGGVVQVNQTEPQLGETTFDLSLLGGSKGRRNITAVMNAPLADDVAFRLAGKYSEFDGWYKNGNAAGGDVSGQERITLMPSMKWEVNENLDVLVRGEYNRTRDDSMANVPWNVCREDPATAAVIPGTGFVTAANDLVIDAVANVFGDPAAAAELCGQPINSDSFTVNHDQAAGNFSKFDVWGLTGQVNYTIPEFGRFTYIANYRDVDEDVINDFDTTPFHIFETRRNQEHWQFSHELRFNADLSDDFDLVLGAYYFEQEYDLRQNTSGLLTAPLPGVFGRSQQTAENWALFGQLDYRVTDDLVLIAGLRYDSEKKQFDHCGVGVGDATTRDCPQGAPTTVDASETWSNLSPKLGAQYFLNADTMAYASWSRAFRSGGFNGRAVAPFSIGPFDEEQADNYEIGIKSELFDGRIRANLSAFWLEYKDLQRPVIRPNPAGGGGQETITENVGEARNRGVELELTALLTDGLSVDWTLGYLDARNEDFCAPLQGVQPTNQVAPGFTQCAPTQAVDDGSGGTAGFLIPIDGTDLDPPQSPEWSSRLSLVYEHSLRESGFITMAGTWRYQSSVSVVGAGLPAGSNAGVVNFNGARVSSQRGSNHTFDLDTTWRSVDDRYRVSAFVKNLTDEQYIATGTFVAGLFNFVQFNEPRHYGVEVAVSLGGM